MSKLSSVLKKTGIAVAAAAMLVTMGGQDGRGPVGNIHRARIQKDEKQQHRNCDRKS